MDLSHLQTFLAVYRARNITRAAESLFLSQPAVTAHIKALEAELGKSLFVRLHRGVEPTSAAHILADRITAPIDELHAVASAVNSETGATISIGGPADVLACVGLPALAPLIRRGLKLDISNGLTRDLINQLGMGELDLVIATTPARHRHVTIQPYFEERLVLVGSPDLRIDSTNIDATKGAVLDAVPLIAYANPAPLVRRYWREQFERPAPTPAVVINDLRAITTAIETGSGWSVLPDYLTKSSTIFGRMQILHKPVTAPATPSTSLREPPTNIRMTCKR
jgi:DNA-binding transcriptional LysR family regulator